MSKVILEGYILVPGSQLEQIKVSLKKHIQLTRQEPGCLVFEVTQDDIEPTRFRVYEEFESEQAFNAHQQRVKQSKWGKDTVDVERHYTIKIME
ncbi:putative quinol monooxygenase [Vibrio ishigakensis]|uniref:putative quinol monooxygenase n=1 Tax=Vibrio ishigakensis TaxID=1481914 RepID=UPI0021C27250|nr:putative quinol monooxygenase [Vibrio ishigakensis]